MPTYTLQKGQQKEDVLLIDGVQSVCPFTAPIPFQGNMGQLQIMRMPCSSLCPLAYSVNERYIIGCGEREMSFGITKEDTPPSEPSKLVSL
jgi:hypothetical protein